MKNKKGITFGRIILYILFAFVIVFLIWSLVLTYRSIRNPNTSEPKIECDSSLRYQYNNAYDYSGADYINTASAYWNYTWNWTYNNVDPFVRGSNYSTTMQPITYDASYNDSQLIRVGADINDNVLNIGSAWLSLGRSMTSIYANTNPGFDNALNSTFMFYSCNMPIQYFRGTFSGTTLNSDFIAVYYVTDLDYDTANNKVNQSHLFYTSNGYFDITSFLPSNLSSATRILYFGFGLFNRDSGFSYSYIGNPFLKSNYATFVNNNSSAYIYLTFDVFNGTNDYQNGYDAGYLAGKNDVDMSYVNANISLENQVATLNNSITELTSRIDSQQIVINDLNTQLNNQTNFKSLFFTLADVPFKTVSNVLGFEVFGLNLFQFFTGILTALGIIWLIKKIL